MDEFFCGIEFLEAVTDQNIPPVIPSRSVMGPLIGLRNLVICNSDRNVGLLVSIIQAAGPAFVVSDESHATEAHENIAIKLTCHNLGPVLGFVRVSHVDST